MKIPSFPSIVAASFLTLMCASARPAFAQRKRSSPQLQEYQNSFFDQERYPEILSADIGAVFNANAPVICIGARVRGQLPLNLFGQNISAYAGIIQDHDKTKFGFGYKDKSYHNNRKDLTNAFYLGVDIRTHRNIGEHLSINMAAFAEARNFYKLKVISNSPDYPDLKVPTILPRFGINAELRYFPLRNDEHAAKFCLFTRSGISMQLSPNKQFLDQNNRSSLYLGRGNATIEAGVAFVLGQPQ